MVVRAVKHKRLDFAHFADFELFISCCLRRDALEKTGTRDEWLQLAGDYQIARGDGISVMVEYCMRKAGPQ